MKYKFWMQGLVIGLLIGLGSSILEDNSLKQTAGVLLLTMPTGYTLGLIVDFNI